MPTDIHHQYMLLCSMSSNREKKILETLKGDSIKKHNQRERELNTNGWKRSPTSEELGIDKVHGYFGVAYYRLDHESKTAEFVIAHRGTCFHEEGNVLADIAIAEKEFPKILTEAAFLYVGKLFGGKNFYDKSLSPDQDLKFENCKIIRITHTGFSLGGFIAGACAGLAQSNITEAITFDAPGVSNVGLDKTEAEKRIINYVTIPNVVNTCNDHIGEVRKLSMDLDNQPRKEKVEFDILFSDIGISENIPYDPNDKSWCQKLEERGIKDQNLLAFLTEINSALGSHNLDKMISASERKLEYQSIYKWPSAENKIIFGPCPGNSSSKSFRGDSSSFWDIAYNIAALGLGLAKYKHILGLWYMTVKDTDQGEEGVVGMRHKRNNLIYFSKEEFLAKAQGEPSLASSSQPYASSSSSVPASAPIIPQFQRRRAELNNTSPEENEARAQMFFEEGYKFIN